MSRNKKSILIVLVILLAVLGIYFLFKDDHQEKGSAKSGGPAMEFSNIEMKEDKDGQSVWRIKAKHVTMSRDKNSADMEGIEAYFLKDGNELKLNADQGHYDRKQKKVHVEGHVEGTLSDGMVLHAKNLTYDGNTDILSTDEFFTAEKDGRVLTAESFTADRVLEKITAKGHARLADKEDAQ